MKGLFLLLLGLLLFNASAQVIVEGKVYDKSGAVPGAVVFIQDSNVAGVTDADGSFRLQVDQIGEVVLGVRFIGYRNVQKALVLETGKNLNLGIEILPDVLGLNDVVVSANRYETDKKESPVVVNVLGPKLFNITQSQSLAEGLNFQSGVRVETNCQNCGFTQVRLNGLEGAYTQILVDSRPVFSSLIGVYGLEMIPTYMIERVEVVKSGGSALYGSNAIAGTVNIITKEPVLNTWEVRSNYSSIGGDALELSHSANGSYVSNDLKFGLSAFVTKRDREAFDANGDGFTELVELNATTLGMKTFYKFSSNTKLKFGLNYIDEFRRGGNSLDLKPELTDITEQLEHDILMTSVELEQYLGDSHKLSAYVSHQKTIRDSYYGGLGGSYTPADSLLAANAYGLTNDESLVGGLQWIYAGKSNHSFTTGIEYQSNTTEDAIPGYNRVVDQSVNSMGYYGQWEWQAMKRLKLLTGARYDRALVDGVYRIGQLERSIDDDFGVISPRFTFLYSLSDQVQLRGGYARGFRAPQAFNEDLHIASAGGEPVFVLLSENLEKETSDAFTASWNYSKSSGGDQLELSFQGFYTQLNNPFVLVNTGSQLPNGSIIEEVRNGVGAIVAGINTEVNYAIGSRWIIQTGATIQKTRFREEQILFEPDQPSEGQLVSSRRFMRMPNAYGYGNVTYQTEKDWQFSLSNVLTGGMLVPEILQSNGNLVLRNSSAFWDATFKASYHFHIGKNLHFDVSGGIQNLFNSYQDDFQIGPTRDSDYIYGPGRPRTYFFSIKLSNND